LRLANLATYLVDRSNWVKHHGFAAKSFGRLVDSAIKFFKKKANVAKASTGGVASAPANKVNEIVNRQAGCWRCSIYQVNMIISVIGGALPLVSGVQRGARVFKGAPPNDAPENLIDLVGGADNGDDINGVENDEDEESLRGRADTSAAGAGLMGRGSFASVSAVAGGSLGGGGGSEGHDDSGRSGALSGLQLAGGASGRSVRAAHAENALIPAYRDAVEFVGAAA